MLHSARVGATSRRAHIALSPVFPNLHPDAVTWQSLRSSP